MDSPSPWKTPLLWTLSGVALSGVLAVLIFGGADTRWVPILLTLATFFALPEIIKNPGRRRFTYFVIGTGCIFWVYELSPSLKTQPEAKAPIAKPVSNTSSPKDNKNVRNGLEVPTIPKPPIPPTKTQSAPLSSKMSDEGTHIGVVVGKSPESNYAYEMRFFLTNHNSDEIMGAYYICQTQKIDKNAKLLGLRFKLAPSPSSTTGAIGNLSSEDSFSIYCDFTADLWANELERPELNIFVFYRYKGKEMQRGFKFLAIPSVDHKGTFDWLPRGEADKLEL